MKLNTQAVLLLLTSIAFHSGFSQNNRLSGNWYAKLLTPAGKMDVAFHIRTNSDEATATMDVPAQGAKDIPASKARIDKDSLILEFDAMRAIYLGAFSNDSIKGKWIQNRFRIPLNLSRTLSVTVRKQDPLPPLPYNSEDVVFENKSAGIKIAGTLTYPTSGGPYMAVVLITGSGSQDRNEEIFGHKPFLVLADHLTRKGIAVLRCDDRGVGGTGGSPKTSTTLDFATDVAAAVDFLKTRKEIDPKKIGLAGHSEGGLIAPIVASTDKTIAFIVLLAGPGMSGSSLLLKQAEALGKSAGLDEEVLAANSKRNVAIYAEAMKNETGSGQRISEMLTESGMSQENADVQTKMLLSPWYRTFLALDPINYLRKVKCPVLALNGKKDLQVPYSENLAGIEKSLVKNKHHSVKAYDDLNHLFQHCKTGNPLEYGSLEETFSPEVLNDISSWLLALQK